MDKEKVNDVRNGKKRRKSKLKEKSKLLINQLGIRLMFAITINFYIFLFVAMTNKHSVEVIFNHFNEAIIEYVIYISILPIIIYAVYYEIKETRKRRKEWRKEKYGFRSKNSSDARKEKKVD